MFTLFVAAPLLVVIAVSFTSQGYLALPTEGVSLRWWRAIAANPQFAESALTSLQLALLSATLATAIAVPAALTIARHSFPGRAALSAALLSPLMVPHVVLGVAMLRLFTQVGINGSLAALVAAHVVVIAPYCLRLVLAALAGADPQMEQAALSLGATPAAAFRRVTLPLILPGVAGGWILAFITSFDELTVSLFVASPSNTPLPVRLFTHIDQMTDPLVASVSAALLAATIVVVVALDRLYPLDRLLTGEARE